MDPGSREQIFSMLVHIRGQRKQKESRDHKISIRAFYQTHNVRQVKGRRGKRNHIKIFTWKTQERKPWKVECQSTIKSKRENKGELSLKNKAHGKALSIISFDEVMGHFVHAFSRQELEQ
ncbi:hypothetical protein Dimus_032857 [Dionaea muscipula]